MRSEWVFNVHEQQEMKEKVNRLKDRIEEGLVGAQRRGDEGSRI